mmetsp:Transcript_16696/g.14611  ORF Transcript_16696/g.14611 Transcript_16696/m.14611 type:complete len:93 (+) Transcript_16696:618-896(+)
MKNCKEVLRDLNIETPNLMKTIIEKSFMLHLFDPFFNNSSIIDFLISEGSHNSVFDFLNSEKENEVENETEYLRSFKNLKPTLTWNLSNIGS